MNLKIAKSIVEKYDKTHRQPYFFIAKNRVLKELLLPTNKNTHKGNFAKVFIWSGKYAGAAHLAAYGALRAGAQKAIIISSGSDNHLPQNPHFIYQSSSEIDFLDCLILGPGLSNDKVIKDAAKDFLYKIAARCETLLFDAEGLELALHHDFGKANIVLTPHPKEAARLLSCTVDEIEQNRFASIERLAKLDVKTTGEIIWVLKGSQTLVYRSRSQELFMFKGGVPTLSVGGTGDVLCGTIAGFIKQTPDMLSAALLANSLMLHAGELLLKKSSRGFFPTEIADKFLECWK